MPHAMINLLFYVGGHAQDFIRLFQIEETLQEGV